MSLGPLPRLLDVSAIIYSARELRDGHLSSLDVQAVATLARIPRWTLAVAELVEAGRWEATQEGGFRIHDYLEFQPSRDEVLAKRESLSAVRAAAGAAGGQAKRKQTASNAGANGVAKPKQTTSKTEAPYPDPVNPVPAPDPVPPHTPPDEQGGRWSARRGRRRLPEYAEPTPVSPQDELHLWCADHTGRFNADCNACRQTELDYVTLSVSRVPR